MSMNTLARLANATNESKYTELQHRNFMTSAWLPGGNGIDRYSFWNDSVSLFYRDDRYLSPQFSFTLVAAISSQEPWHIAS